MRLFIALDIPTEIRDRITRFVDGIQRFAPDANWVKPASYHITLKFIGEKSAEDADRLKQTLSTLKSQSVTVAFRGSGFFPNARFPRVFWAGMEHDPALPALAKAVDAACASLGIAREEHEYRPHLTLARGGSGSPNPKRGEHANPKLKQLAEKLQDLPFPEFGTMTAQEFFLYESKLSPGGAQYTKLQRFALLK
ncbi:MAG TPA: RNA 2',3'-cyclic phosphodiesterase [Terriglobales bacterium]|nr:RNA 2',3'-cyclic phosphodiesterase [Terriglobales bacterium]